MNIFRFFGNRILQIQKDNEVEREISFSLDRVESVNTNVKLELSECLFVEK